jgi:hypothetical protein
MSDEDLKAELERLRNENAALKNKGTSSSVRKRKGSGFNLWHGALSCNIIQRTVVEAAGHVSRNSRVHRRKRSTVEEQGIMNLGS